MANKYNSLSHTKWLCNFIKELYYGNIDPQARSFKNGSYLKKQITILSEREALLTDKLTGDEKKAFLSFVNASDIILGESELDSFMVGFRLGARFILLVNQLAEKEGVTEQLKADNQMLWVRKMNNIRNRAEEIINNELIYT